MDAEPEAEDEGGVCGCIHTYIHTYIYFSLMGRMWMDGAPSLSVLVWEMGTGWLVGGLLHKVVCMMGSLEFDRSDGVGRRAGRYLSQCVGR